MAATTWKSLGDVFQILRSGQRGPYFRLSQLRGGQVYEIGKFTEAKTNDALDDEAISLLSNLVNDYEERYPGYSYEILLRTSPTGRSSDVVAFTATGRPPGGVEPIGHLPTTPEAGLMVGMSAESVQRQIEDAMNRQRQEFALREELTLEKFKLLQWEERLKMQQQQFETERAEFEDYIADLEDQVNNGGRRLQAALGGLSTRFVEGFLTKGGVAGGLGALQEDANELARESMGGMPQQPQQSAPSAAQGPTRVFTRRGAAAQPEQQPAPEQPAQQPQKPATVPEQMVCELVHELTEHEQQVLAHTLARFRAEVINARNQPDSEPEYDTEDNSETENLFSAQALS